MRRSCRLAVVAGVALVASTSALTALAQSQRDDDARRQAEADADKKKKQKEKDWSNVQAPLPDVKNAGPCPYVKVLYDASRYVEMKSDQETSSAVGWTGEIENVQSRCSYKSNEPITVAVRVNFQFGRGPQAQGSSKIYRYWVAVTQRNASVLDRKTFEIPVDFGPGQDRATRSDLLQRIVIPRADAKVNGANFEVLVGFEVTPKMAEFNRQGKRFRVNAGGETQVAATP